MALDSWGQPTATLLMPNSTTLSKSTKDDVFEALDKSYGGSSVTEKDKEYLKLLEDRTYRAWKTVAPGDPQAQRFLAEMHAMRAFAVAFLILVVVTLAGAGIYGNGNMSLRTHGTLAVAYALLFVTSLWRMNNKAVTFAQHVLVTFVEKANEKKEQDERP